MTNTALFPPFFLKTNAFTLKIFHCNYQSLHHQTAFCFKISPTAAAAQIPPSVCQLPFTLKKGVHTHPSTSTCKQQNGVSRWSCNLRHVARLSPFLYCFTTPVNSLIFHACVKATSLPSVASCIQFVLLQTTNNVFSGDIFKKQLGSLKQGLSIVSVKTISVYSDDIG